MAKPPTATRPPATMTAIVLKCFIILSVCPCLYVLRLSLLDFISPPWWRLRRRQQRIAPRLGCSRESRALSEMDTQDLETSALEYEMGELHRSHLGVDIASFFGVHPLRGAAMCERPPASLQSTTRPASEVINSTTINSGWQQSAWVGKRNPVSAVEKCPRPLTFYVLRFNFAFHDANLNQVNR